MKARTKNISRKHSKHSLKKAAAHKKHRNDFTKHDYSSSRYDNSIHYFSINDDTIVF